MAAKVFALALLLFTVACGSNNNQTSSTDLAGTWAIAATETGGSASALQATLVSSACSVGSSVGTFTVQGPKCFLADNQTGQGSVSAVSGQFFLPPQGVLVGTPTDPIAANATGSIDLLFVEADQSGNVAVFSGNGTVINGAMSGTFSCYPGLSICSGATGTFSGTKN